MLNLVYQIKTMEKNKKEGYYLNIKNRQSFAVLFLFSFFGLLYFNCSPKYADLSPPIDDFQEFTASGDSLVTDKWWEVFNDDKLNILIDSAMQSNLNLAVCPDYQRHQLEILNLVWMEWYRIHSASDQCFYHLQ